MKLFTDNQNVERIACKGSMIDELHQLAMRICGVCVKLGIFYTCSGYQEITMIVLIVIAGFLTMMIGVYQIIHVY